MEGAEAGRGFGRLPPLQDSSVLTDWNDWLFECPACRDKKGQKWTLPNLVKHQKWHARINILFHLRTTIKQMEVSPFGPTSLSGSFLTLDYEAEDMLLQAGATKEDILKDFDRRSQTPFVTLSYDEGRKFTFGSKFSGRQIQGDFIYFEPPNDGHETHEDQGVENYCQLECKDEGIWISVKNVEGTRPSTVFSVNGLVFLHGPEEGIGGESKLEFGDIVSISVGDDGNEENFMDLVFMPQVINLTSHTSMEVAPNVENETLSISPLENSLILQNILHFLSGSPQDLQQLRFLSHLWNSEALKLLKNRTIITLCNLGWTASINGLFQISDIGHSQLNEFQFTHWKIKIPMDAPLDNNQRHAVKDGAACPEDFQSSGVTSIDKKILEDLTWFLNLQSHNNVQSLLFHGRLENELRFQMFENVVHGLQTTLTSLDLKINCFVSSFPHPLEEMKRLKTLSLAFDGFKRGSPSCIMTFLTWFLPSTSNIQTLRLNESIGPPVRTTVFFVKWVLVDIANLQQQTNEPPMFRRLCQVAATDGDYQSYSLSSLREASLKKVELGELRGWSYDDLTSILGGHVQTLKKLTLHFNFKSRVIEFPQIMPNLKTLNIFFCLYVYEGLSQESPLSFVFGFPGRVALSMDYATVFPSLSNLTVWPVDDARYSTCLNKSVERTAWDTFLPILTPFIQTEDRLPVNSIKVLDIPFALGGRYHDVLDNLEVTFPNAVFPPELAAAREGPIWAPVVAVVEEDQGQEVVEVGNVDE